MSGLAEFESLFVRPKDGPTLIVGSKVYGAKEDRRKRYPDATGIDMAEGDGVDIVCDLEEPLYDIMQAEFAHVECMSVLEHSRRPWLLAANLEKLMAPGATIFVSVPWIWRYHPYDLDYWRFSKDGIAALFPNIEWKHLLYAGCHHVTHKSKTDAKKDGAGGVFLERTETCGFGVRK